MSAENTCAAPNILWSDDEFDEAQGILDVWQEGMGGLLRRAVFCLGVREQLFPKLLRSSLERIRESLRRIKELQWIHTTAKHYFMLLLLLLLL